MFLSSSMYLILIRYVPFPSFNIASYFDSKKCCLLFKHTLFLQKTLIIFLSGLHSCFGILISTKLNLSRSIMQPP